MICRKLRVLSLIFALTVGFCCCAFPKVSAAGALSVSAESAILMDASDGTVLWEKNAHTAMGPASTTKLMTALVAICRMSPDQMLTVPREACGIEGSSVYLCEGEQLTLEQLLYAMLLSSANDAATAIALCVGGSMEGFCALMNQKADELALENTRFQNPHGLYHEQHYTTAHDLARIAVQVLSDPLLARIVATYKTYIPKGDDPNARLLVNHNKLLRTYEGAIGLKTGFTKKTGRTLVSAARREGLTLIAITLRDGDDWRDHAAMLDYGFSSYQAVTVAEAGALRIPFAVVGGETDEVLLTNTQPLILTLPKGSPAPTLSVYATGRFLYAPCPSGQVAGTVTASVSGKTVSSPLCTLSAISSPPKKRRFS